MSWISGNAQPTVTFQCRHFGPRISREAVLIFKTGYLHIRRDPPVLLPVNPDEDLTLLQVRSVERPRRVGPSPLLEHDRCKPKVADPLPGGVAFLPQFSK